MIDLTSLINNPDIAKNIRIEIPLPDLLSFGEFLISEANKENKKNMLEKKEEYLTPKQFAEELNISLVTLWTYDKKEITKPLYFGNQKRYRRSDIEKIFMRK